MAIQNINAIGLNVQGFLTGVQNIQASINNYNISIKNMAATTKQASTQMKEAGLGLDKFFISFSKLMQLIEIQVIHRVFGNLITAMQNSVVAASQLGTAISEIRTISQQSGISFDEFASRFRALSEEFGKPQTEVAKAAYEGFSSQVIKTREDLEVLNQAMILSRTAVSSPVAAMNVLSSVINAYSLNNSEAAATAAQLFKIIELGTLRLSDLEGHLGKVAVVGAQVGISFQEIGAALTIITRQGVNSAEAITQISALISGLLKPSKELQEVMRRSWGVESAEQAVRAFGGMTGVIAKIREEVQKGNVSIEELFPNIRASRATRGLFNLDSSGMENEVNQIRNSSDSYRRAQEEFKTPFQSFQQELERVRNWFVNDFGMSFVKTLQDMAAPFGGISESIKSIGETVKTIIGVATTVIKIFGEAINSVAENASRFLNIFGAGIENIDKFTVSLGFLAKGFIYVKIASLATRASLLLLSLSGLTTAATFTTVNGVLVVTAARLTAFGAATKAALIGLGGIGIALLALDLAAPLLDKFDKVKIEIEALNALAERLAKQNRKDKEEEDRKSTEAAQAFRTDLDRRFSFYYQYIARVRQLNNKKLEEDKKNTAEALDRFKEASAGILGVQAKIISDLKSNVSKATDDIQSSLRRVASFADREATSKFNKLLKITSQGPEVISTVAPADLYQRDLQRQSQDIVARNQRALIQQRINTLEREALDLQERLRTGTVDENRITMEGINRRTEELRRLNEQQAEASIEEQRRRRIRMAEDTGETGIINIPVNPRIFDDSVRRTNEIEEQAQRTFREAQARERARASERIAAEQGYQEALQRSITALERFRITNDQGQSRFAGNPREQIQQGQEQLRRLMAEIQRASTRTPEQLAELTPEERRNWETTRTEAWRRAEDLRRSISQQINTQITADWLNEQERLIRTQQENILRLRTAAQSALTTANASTRTETENIIASLTRLLTAVPLTPIQNAFSIGAGDAINNQFNTLTTRVTEAKNALTRFNQTPTDLNFIALQRAVNAASTAYREYIRLSQEAGRRVGNVADPTQNLVSATERIAAARQAAITARQQLAQAEEVAKGLGDISKLPPELQNIIIQGRIMGITLERGFDGAKRAIDGMVASVERLTASLREINGLPALPDINNPVNNPPGNAYGGRVGYPYGGLLGDTFSQNGPDNMLINARRGEYIINPNSTQRFYPQLVAMNQGRVPHFDQGGQVGSTNVGDITINVNESSTPETTARHVMNRMRREFRRNTGRI